MSMILATRGLTRHFEAPASPVGDWYGLVDFGEDNGSTPNRHYTIASEPVLNLIASTGWAWGCYVRLSQNAGSSFQYVLSTGTVNTVPSYNLHIDEASQTSPNAYVARVNDFGPTGAGSTGVVELDQIVLVVSQYDGADQRLWICEPGGSPVQVGFGTGPDADMVAPEDWNLGRRTDGDADRYFQEELGGLFKADRALTTDEIAQIAAGASPVTVLGDDCAGAWAFKNGAVPVEPDLTSNGNDVTRGGSWGTAPGVLRWRFDETVGSTAVDDLGLQNGSYFNGVALGALPMLADGGTAIALKDGASARIPHNAAFEVPTWGISCVAMAAVMPPLGATMNIVTKVPASGHVNEFVVAFINTSGQLRINAYTTTDAGVAGWIVDSAGVGNLTVGQSYSVALVQRATGASLYIDGVEFGPNAVTDGLEGNTGAIVWGGYLSGAQLLDPLDGCIDDGRFHTTAPTVQEIEALPAAQDTLHLVDFGQNVAENSSGSIDPAPHAWPETGFTTEVMSDGTFVDLTADSAVVDYVSDPVDENEADSATIRLLKGALLSRTATIALTVIDAGAGGGSGDAPQIPSLAEFLANDGDQVPGDAISVTEGNLQSQLNSASPGDTFVANVGPGIHFWAFPNGLDCPNGTAGNPITLMAPIGAGVVISRAEDFAAFRTTGAGNWTQSGLSQADIDKKIWRSTSASFGAAATLMGFWIEFDHPHQMVRCGSLTDLRAAYNTADSPTGYSGPQARLHTDGRIYIRMQKPHPTKYSRNAKWSGREWEGFPGGDQAYVNGVINYPVSEDPNDYVIHLFRAGATSGATIAFDLGASGNHFKIGAGINSLGHGRVGRGSNVTIRRGTHLVWRYGLFFSPSGGPDHEDWDVQRARFSDGSKLHISRSEWKFGGWLEDIRSGFVYTQSGDLGRNSRRIFLKNCTIADFHELQVGGDEQYRYRNCSMLHIYDDGIQSPQNLSRVEIGYCYFRGSAFGGSGQSGAEADDPNPGEWFIHHNIFDNRENRNLNWSAEPSPKTTYIQHSPDHNQPRKYYNCTMFVGPDLEQEIHLGLSANSDRNNTSDGTHEVFNMIVVRQDDQRYDPTTGYSDSPNDGLSDYLSRYVNCDADLSNEYWDYNLWHKDVPSPLEDGWGRNIRAGRDVNENSFASLAAFRSSALFTLSKAGGTRRGAYTPGFEANSAQSEPPIESVTAFPSSRFSYRPSATSAVTTATTSSLSGENWWSGDGPSWGRVFPWNDGAMTLQPSGYKGALDPNGSTMPVGVQDPGAAPDPGGDTTTDPILHLTMDQTSGSMVDSVFGNNGIVTGALERGLDGILTGSSGSAASDGSGSGAVTISHIGQYEKPIWGAATWVQIDALPAVGDRYVYAAKSQTGQSGRFTFEIHNDGGVGRIRFALGGTFVDGGSGVGVVEPGVATRICFDYDGTNARIWQDDGAPIASTPIANGGLDSNTTDLVLYQYHGAAKALDGILDDFVLYDFSLDQTFVEALAPASSITHTPPPIEGFTCLDRTSGALVTTFKDLGEVGKNDLWVPTAGGNARHDMTGSGKRISLANTPPTSSQEDWDGTRCLLRLDTENGAAAHNGACFSGFYGVCDNMDRNFNWDALYDSTNQPRPLIHIRGQGLHNLLFEGIRAHALGWDVAGIGDLTGNKTGISNLTFRKMAVTLQRDDCIENDTWTTGLLVDDCYIETFVLFSCRNSGFNGSSRVSTFQNTLCYVLPCRISGVANRLAGQYFKVNANSVRVRLLGATVAVPDHDSIIANFNNWGPFSDLYRREKAHPDSDDILVCWLGTGSYPYDNPDPSRITIIQSTEAQTEWDSRKSAWWAAYPGPRLNIPGVIVDPPAAP